MESLLLYLARGLLPWQGLTVTTEEENNVLIKQKKLSMPVTESREDHPGELAKYASYILSPGFNDRPDYAYLCRLFRTAH